MLLRIVKYGEPVLEQVAEPVTNFGSAELKQLVDDMFETMYANKGIGLAAPQVNLALRLFVCDVSVGEDPAAKLALINPEILVKEGRQVGEEGCLSIPGFREEVSRAYRVRVRAQNTDGEFFELDAEELKARCIQHENDHLNGILFLAHLSALKRDLIRRKIRKLAKAGEWD